MILSQITGFSPVTAALTGVETIEMVFKAGGAITVGAPVMIDVTDTSGKAVTTGTTTTKTPLMAGVYEGKGGTGTATAVSGLTGKAAVSGDIILIKVFGVASVIATPKTSSDLSTSGKALALGTTAGQAEGYDVATAKMGLALVSLEVGATTAVSTSVIKAFCRFV